MEKDKPSYSFTIEEVYKAYNDCMHNKKSTANAIKFSVDGMEKLMALCDEVNDGTYEIGNSITFIVKFPVLREVFAADFRDRIIHHLIMNELMPYFEREFVDDTFSCRKGKGVLYGVDTVYRHIKECTENYTRDAWILKLDVKSFFMTIDKELLSELVDDMIVRLYPENRKKQALRGLCKKVILHQPQLNCERRGDTSLWDELPRHKSLFNTPKEKGLAIGNLTSQIFANYYMSGLDHYIKEVLGFKYYGRYVDDLVIVSTDREKLLAAVPLIAKYAKEKLMLTIHPNKRYFQHYKNGVRFIGGVLKSGRKYVINRTRGSLIYKLKTYFKHYSPKKEMEFMMCVNSYFGFMGHYDSYNIRKQILTDKELLKEWLPHIIIDTKNYRKINLVERDESVQLSEDMADSLEMMENMMLPNIFNNI